MDVVVTMSPTTYFFTAVLSPTRVLLLVTELHSPRRRTSRQRLGKLR